MALHQKASPRSTYHSAWGKPDASSEPEYYREYRYDRTKITKSDLQWLPDNNALGLWPESPGSPKSVAQRSRLVPAVLTSPAQIIFHRELLWGRLCASESVSRRLARLANMSEGIRDAPRNGRCAASTLAPGS